jgi:hypothetical protein
MPALADNRFHGALAQARRAVAQHRFNDMALAKAQQGLCDDLGQGPPAGHHEAVDRSGLPRAGNQIGIRQRSALFKQQAGDLRIVAQQHTGQGIGDFGQRGQAGGDPATLLRRGQLQHFHQQVAGDGTLKGVDPAGRQGHDIGEAFQQRMTRTEAAFRGGLLRADRGFGHVTRILMPRRLTRRDGPDLSRGRASRRLTARHKPSNSGVDR